MAYGYSNNAPKYGYQRPGGASSATSPYYKSARMLANATPLFPSPNNRSGPMGANPFPTLDPTRPNDRGGPLGIGANPKRAAVAPNLGYTQDQVAASLAANPHASSGGFGVDELGQAVGAPIGATSSSPPPLYDYRTDPALLEIEALTTKSGQDAETGALALKKQVAQKFGDAPYLRNVLGDTASADAAAANPYSVFASLKNAYDLNAHNTDEAYNKSNLFYSGARVQGQQQIADDYQRQLASEAGNEQDALAQIENNKLAALLGAHQQNLDAEKAAANAAIDRAIAGGYTFGGWDEGGKPILTPPPTATAATIDASGVNAPAPPVGDASGARGAIPSDAIDSLAYLLGVAHRKRDPRDLLAELAA